MWTTSTILISLLDDRDKETRENREIRTCEGERVGGGGQLNGNDFPLDSCYSRRLRARARIFE